MADKKVNNITLPDGSTVTIPAWASDDTMNQVVAYMSATNKVDQRFIKLINNLGGDLGTMQKAISDLSASVVRDAKQDDKTQEQTLDFAKAAVGGAKQITKMSKFFGNAEQPLSSLKEAASSAWDSLKGSSFSKQLTDKVLGSVSNPKFKTAMEAGGAAIDVGMDAALAYAGWNAAKYEQFAKAQGSAIDFGIMLEGGAAAYDELRFDAIAGGITYKNLIETAGKYSDAMFGLGTTMGTGSEKFADMFKRLNTAADAYGDFGMTSSEMVDAYAEYLSYQRRSGRLRNDMNASAEEINQEFINLQIETGAIASLTALSRREVMSRRMQSLNTFGEAALIKLEQSGFTGQAAVAREMLASLNTVGRDSTVLSGFMNAVQDRLLAYSDNIEDFNIEAALTPDTLVAIQQVFGVDFIENMERAIRSGSMSAEQAQAFIYDAIKNANVTTMNFAAATNNAVSESTRALTADVIKIKQLTENLGDPEKLEQARADQAKNLAAAGNVTKNLNNMTARFLDVQERLTLNLETTEGYFDFLIDALKTSKDAFTKILNDLKGGGDGNVNGEDDGFGGIKTPARPDMRNYTGTTEGDYNSFVQSQREWDEKYSATHNPDGTAKADTSSSFTGDATSTVPASTGGLNIDTTDGNNDDRDARLATLISKEGPLTVEDFAGFTQISNVERTVAQLNTLTPEMRRRVTGAVVDFEQEYKGTDTKLLISEGFRSNERSAQLRASGIQAAGAGNSWHNYGMAVDVLGVQNGKIIENNNSGFYKGSGSKLEEIMARHGLHNNQGAGDTGHFQPIETDRRVDPRLKGGANPAEYLDNWHTIGKESTARARSRSASTTTPTPASYDPSTLGMIGGVRDESRVWQGFNSKGMAHDTEYKDYSQLFREYTFEEKDGYVQVGEQDGRAVYAAPDYAKDEEGNYISVNKEEAAAMAEELGGIIPTREMVKSLYDQAERITMPTYKDGKGDSADYTRRVNESIESKGIESGTAIVHGKEFYSDVQPARPTAPTASDSAKPTASEPAKPTASEPAKSYTSADVDYVEQIRKENDMLGGGALGGDTIRDLTDGQRAYAIEKGYLKPKARLFGGAVAANMPYIVGDQLGLNTAELFVPESAGNIVNNKDLRNVISSTLTDTIEPANIKNVDLSSLLSSKEDTLAAAKELRNALKTMMRNIKTKSAEDITNSR